jgi:hypothetical protein
MFPRRPTTGYLPGRFPVPLCFVRAFFFFSIDEVPPYIDDLAASGGKNIVSVATPTGIYVGIRGNAS